METSALVDGEGRSTELQERTPLPQAEAGAGPMLEEATLIEGMYPTDLSTCRVE